MDGDPVAAMRYTEAKLEKLANDVLADMDKDTVDFQLNIDDTIPEPTVLPTKAPLLLLNGSAGIAVGMATNMAPHTSASAAMRFVHISTTLTLTQTAS